ncbi:hypothetical protein GCM10010245_72610 [Streptomyces spectabilis]|nr:hypothetical protein GCM10010245_72610 [Streptomyces spectabilis]
MFPRHSVYATVPPGFWVRGPAGTPAAGRPLRLRLVSAYDAVAAGIAVAPLTPDQVSHGASYCGVVLDPGRRCTHDLSIHLPVESVEAGSGVDGEQFVHGLPLSGEGTSQVTTDGVTLKRACDRVRPECPVLGG